MCFLKASLEGACFSQCGHWCSKPGKCVSTCILVLALSLLVLLQKLQFQTLEPDSSMMRLIDWAIKTSRSAKSPFYLSGDIRSRFLVWYCKTLKGVRSRINSKFMISINVLPQSFSSLHLFVTMWTLVLDRLEVYFHVSSYVWFVLVSFVAQVTVPNSGASFVR